jgi:hypothetical protein
MERQSLIRASFGAKNGRWRERQHQLALDAHKAMRARVTERITQAHPELGERDLWQAVSHDEKERAAWRHRQQRRKVVARTHERGGSARILRISSLAALSTSLISSRSRI